MKAGGQIAENDALHLPVNSYLQFLFLKSAVKSRNWAVGSN